MRDASVDSLIRKMISARMQESPGGCADENTMAAYLESKLTPPEKAVFEAHVSDCSACQEVLGLALKLETQEIPSQEVAEQTDGKKLLFRFSVPIPVVLGSLIAIVLIGAVLFRVLQESGRDRQAPQSAELHIPAIQTEIAGQDTPAQAPVTNQEPLVQKGSAIAPQSSSNEAKEFASSERKRKMETVAPAAAVSPAEPSAPGETEVQKMAEADVPLLRGEESISRPSIYAAQNRIATGATLNMAPIRTASDSATSPKDAIAQLGATANLEAAGSRRIGEKVFYLNSGYWIDRQCLGHQAEPIVEISYAAPEYQKILEQYPELRSLRPVLVYWEGKNYLLMP